jgi:hypothetical protein
LSPPSFCAKIAFGAIHLVINLKIFFVGTIVDYKVSMNSKTEPFNALIAQREIELVKSKETGLFYATSRKATIPSTFDEKTAESLIGQQLDGTGLTKKETFVNPKT